MQDLELQTSALGFGGYDGTAYDNRTESWNGSILDRGK